MTMRLTVLAPLLLAACAAGPTPDRSYLLEAPPLAVAPAPVAGAAPVGLRELALPLYARRPQIAAEDEAGRVAASDAHRWAEDPPRAATRLVARRLAALRGGDVFADPWPQGAAPEIVATIEIDRLLGAPGGEARLDGQLTLACARARDRRETRPFALRVPVAESGEPEGRAALAEAYGAALAALAGETATALAAFGSCPR